MSRFLVLTDSGTFAPADVARIVNVDDDESFAEVLSDGERNTLALLHGSPVVASGRDDTVTLELSAETIREHYQGSPWAAEDFESLTDEDLRRAGELVVHRKSDLFWEAVDALYSDALAAAKEFARERRSTK